MKLKLLSKSKMEMIHQSSKKPNILPKASPKGTKIVQVIIEG